MSGIYKVIASGFGSGYSPFAPGTAGSLVALIPVALCFYLNWPSETSSISLNTIILILTMVFLVLGILSSNKLEKLWGHDAQKIVVDEMVGQWIALLFIPISWLNILLAFILFRLFDIFKPWPIRNAEKWPAGWGVMGDDVLAGIFANIVLLVINKFI